MTITEYYAQQEWNRALCDGESALSSPPPASYVTMTFDLMGDDLQVVMHTTSPGCTRCHQLQSVLEALVMKDYDGFHFVTEYGVPMAMSARLNALVKSVWV